MGNTTGGGIDFTRGIPICCTVVHCAIMMAIYMGFSEIYLLGCDCTNILMSINRALNKSKGTDLYAYTITDNEEKRLKKMSIAHPLEGEFAGAHIILKHYRILNEYAENKGIKIVNCTKGGLLDCLPRKPYEEVIGEK